MGGSAVQVRSVLYAYAGIHGSSSLNDGFPWSLRGGLRPMRLARAGWRLCQLRDVSQTRWT